MESQQANPYQANQYQANQYQANPYQVNPYQADPYQANPQQANPQQSLPRNGENGANMGYKPELDNQHQVELESQTQARQHHEMSAQPGRVEATDGRPPPQELPMNYR
jgi:hypothetical protein